VIGEMLKDYSRTGESTLRTEGSNAIRDPQVSGWREGKVRFEADSPARELGIRPFDVSRAGPRP